MFYVGIDIAKVNHCGCIIDDAGNVVEESFSFSNTVSGGEKFVSKLVKSNICKDNILIGMEATGHYWLSVYSFLNDLGYPLVVINPIQTDAYRKFSIRKSKTDPIDAKLIANIIRTHNYQTSSFSEENIFALRQLSRYRMSLVDNCSDLKRQIIALLDQVFPEYDKQFSDVFGVTSKELLSKCPTPEDLLTISTTKLSNLLEKNSRGRFGLEKAKELKESASKTFGIKFAKDAFSFQIKQLIGQIGFIEDQIKELEKKLNEILTSLDSQITTIPGIGPVTGAIILSEIGDISRFSDPSKIVAFAGLDASVKESGNFVGTQNHISKRGSPYLRRAIWTSAGIAAMHDPVLKEYYQKKRAQGKHHGTAIGAVATKLVRIIYAVLTTNQPYELRK